MRTLLRGTVLAAVIGGLCASDAQAWGGRAQQTIAAMALQVIKDSHPDVFRPGGQSFEKDVLRGAGDGYKVLGDSVPLTSPATSVQAVATEIQLLKSVRAYGPTTYFAYRMGVLSTLVADVMLPYGFAWTPEEKLVREQVNADLDVALDRYNYTPNQKRRIYIRDYNEYFRVNRAFYDDDKRLIADDYRRGAGVKGFLREGGQAYFTRSVEAVADAWHTVLSTEKDPGFIKASPVQLTWYFVDEIAYLLMVKRNFHQADKTYANFELVNPNLGEAYARLGDLFYAFGEPEAVERGVREWRKAHDSGGLVRNQVAAKLATHYLKEGDEYFAKGTEKGADETDLPNALRAFEMALEFERTNEDAAGKIQRTHIAINERREAFETTLKIIATGEKVLEQGEREKVAGKFGPAITTFRQAISIFSAVDDTFPEQERVAKASMRSLDKNITDTVNQVLDAASEAISQGETYQSEHKYQEAISSYERVRGILGIIPDDVAGSQVEDKNKLINDADAKTEEAKVAKIKYEEAQKANEAARASGRRPAGAGGAAGARGQGQQ